MRLESVEFWAGDHHDREGPSQVGVSRAVAAADAGRSPGAALTVESPDRPPDLKPNGAEYENTPPRFYLARGRDDLSPRQLEILSLAAQGLLDREIAERLQITGSTVRQHLCKIHHRLKARNTTHAVAIALERHIIQLEDLP